MVSELARSVAARERSPREAVQPYLDRIAELNPHLNALTRVLEPVTSSTGPLAGVPFSVKENIDLAGTPTTFGLRGPHPDAARDAPHIAHLRAAGAVPIARGNLPDLALRWHTDNARHGATLNPHDATLSPGGSSGGDAVAVASGMVPFAVGSDYGGSLRVPAALAGIYALRPTPGRLAMAGPPPAMTRQLFATDGPLATSVDDLALLLSIMAQPSARDPRYTAATPWPPERVRVAAVDEATAELVGADEVIEPPHVPELAQLWIDLLEFEARFTALPRLRAEGSEGTRRSAEAMFALAAPLDGEGYAAGLTRRHVLAAAWSEHFARYPVVAGPVSFAAPWPVGHDQGGVEALHDEWWGYRLTVATAALGVPALSLPDGVQLIGARFTEDLLLRVARARESRRGPTASSARSAGRAERHGTRAG